MKVEFNGHGSRLFHIDSRKLFLIFINDFPDIISLQLWIYTEVKTIYSCLTIMSDRSDRVKLVAALENDI